MVISLKKVNHLKAFYLNKFATFFSNNIAFLKKAYPGLHDLELELAVKKVGEV